VALTEDLLELDRPCDPQLSPDGARVAWLAAPYGDGGEHPDGAVWMALLDGSAPPRRLTCATGRSDRPRWSPGGGSLAFRSDRRKRGVFGLYLLRLDGGEAEPLYVSERDVEHFAWSPDGAALALVVPDDPDEDEHRRQKRGDDAEVYGRRWPYARLRVLALDSREVRDVAAGEFHVSEAAWSPDGLRLAYLWQPTPELDARLQTVLCVRPAAGGPAAVVCSAPRASGLVWSGDDRIMYTAPADVHWQSAQVVWAVDPAGGPPQVMAPESGEEACGLGVIAAHAQPVVVVLAQGLDSCLEVLAAGGRRAPLQITTPRWWTEADRRASARTRGQTPTSPRPSCPRTGASRAGMRPGPGAGCRAPGRTALRRA
jgi:dipeptidyl aminopeptidase/acylaminoacyl peptidase